MPMPYSLACGLDPVHLFLVVHPAGRVWPSRTSFVSTKPDPSPSFRKSSKLALCDSTHFLTSQVCTRELPHLYAQPTPEMKTSTTVILALPALSLAVVPPSSHLVQEPSSARTSPSKIPLGETSELTPSLLLPSGGGLVSANAASAVHDEEGIVPSSIAVGILTAAMGFAYGKILSATLALVWRKLPRWLDSRWRDSPISRNPSLFVTAVCTVGGLVMGILSSVFDEAFTVADFVSALSKAPIEALPSSR